jgi:hypothetical protein
VDGPKHRWIGIRCFSFILRWTLPSAAIRKKESTDTPNTSKTPKVPLAYPEARILPNKGGGFAPNYTMITATESRNGFIMDAEVILQGVKTIRRSRMVIELSGDCLAVLNKQRTIYRDPYEKFRAE